MEFVAVAGRAVAVLVVPVTVVVLAYVAVAVTSMCLCGSDRSHALRVLEGLTELARVVRPQVVVRSRRDER